MITMWRGNRISDPVSIDLEDLVRDFWTSEVSRHPWPIERRVLAFITDWRGESLVFDPDDFDQIINQVIAGRPAQTRRR